jgi:hypothetical protein
MKYGKLNPNYTLHLYADEDAASSIDPVDVILYYKSRGFEPIYDRTFNELLFLRKYSVFLRKL